ncbi:sodium-coupled monocarboxylate transporter 2-like isoform X1 [Drosophila pseudoobscura]|uniref:Sodium-coupled monocarboxylate transporter 2-like isoform X1 n=1 Tax=Drosophila pseudoobscura pseudoobscura TaxID=46245 RepID=A0A6I8VX75_DROPS|nr:sodium-coupled monocarboxylate transporter 2 isoform X1 [Drosophila pseudoobscura]XP_033235663.1 sodium-coupled monocarboxylate transporter 2 isoform X1 [Drosophila pseudoobscura]
MTNAKSYRFGIVDWMVFLGMTVLSTAVGIYFAIIKKSKPEQEEPKPTVKHDFGSEKMSEYLLGSRNLKVLPVAMSLVASYISGVTILGTPSEVYYYGTQYWFITIAILLHGFAVVYIYLPVFCALRVGSSYEYLGMRFHSAIRSIAAFMFVLDEILFLPFVVYVPSLALDQVSGINLHYISVVIVVVCVLYTLLGGIKAVVHTDAWQILVMFLSVLAVAILATYYCKDWDGLESRIIFTNISPSPYVRHTVWCVLIGGFFYWTSFNAVNQTMVQRYMSLPSLKKARMAMAIFTIGVACFLLILCYMGLIIFGKYKDCDPKISGLIEHDDQLLPLFVVQTMGHIYGIPGLFIAGIFGAALSSLSVMLNCTSLVVLEDIVRGCFKMEPSERVSTILVKSTIIVLGFVAVSLVFVLEKLSGILGIAISITAIASGATFGLFSLGMLVPWANTVGTAVGGIASALISGWITFGTQFTIAAGKLGSQALPVFVEGCEGNVTIPQTTSVDQEQVLPLYRLSFHWVNPIGVATAIVVGALVSLVTKPTDMKTLDPDLISPVIHRFLPKECFEGRNLSQKSERKTIPKS